MTVAAATRRKRKRFDVREEIESLTRRLEQIEQVARPSARWWVDAAGRFEGDAVFDEIARLGRKFRNAGRAPRRGGHAGR